MFPCVSIVRRKHGKKPKCGALLSWLGTRSRVFKRLWQKNDFFFLYRWSLAVAGFQALQARIACFFNTFFCAFFRNCALIHAALERRAGLHKYRKTRVFLRPGSQKYRKTRGILRPGSLKHRKTRGILRPGSQKHRKTLFSAEAFSCTWGEDLRWPLAMLSIQCCKGIATALKFDSF